MSSILKKHSLYDRNLKKFTFCHLGADTKQDPIHIYNIWIDTITSIEKEASLNCAKQISTSMLWWFLLNIC